jgi:hypothetical protein
MEESITLADIEEKLGNLSRSAQRLKFYAPRHAQINNTLDLWEMAREMEVATSVVERQGDRQ